MKRVVFTLLFTISIGFVFGQSNGDYRTRVFGNWNQRDRWDVFYNGAWRKLNTSAAGPYANVLPSSSSGQITIRHLINVYGNISINQLVIENGATLFIQSGVVVTVVDDFVTAPFIVRVGGLLRNNGTLDLQSQLTSTTCVIEGTLRSVGLILTVNPALVNFMSGSHYQHGNVSGGNIPLATWHVNSNCDIIGMAQSNAVPPGNLGQPFGNFTVNSPSMGSGVISLGGGLQTVNGNLNVVSTGSRVLRFGYAGGGYTLNIGGNLSIGGGAITLAESLSSATTLNIAGNLNMTGGTLRMGTNNNSAVNVRLNGNFVKTGGTLTSGTVPGGAYIRFDGAEQTYLNNQILNSPVHFVVENGSTLNLGTSFLTGTGNFFLLTGGTLRAGSTDSDGAIQLGTSGGNIRMSGPRTYQTGSTVIYDGNGTQFMASGHPANSNTLLDNGDSVYLVGNVTINGTLTQNVPLILSSYTLTMGGSYVRNDQFFGILSTSSLVLNGTGDLDLLLAPVGTTYPVNPINNFTINRAGTVIIRRNLIVQGSFNMANGTLLIGGVDQQDASYELVLRGNVSRTAGTLAILNHPNLTIEGSGTLPPSFPMVLQTPTSYIGQLTMNRTGSTFNTNAVITLDTLNLFSGIVNNTASNLTVRSGGLIVRRSGGSVNQVLSAQTSYNVIYEVATDITTGNELPNVATALHNLTKKDTAAVVLNKDVTINGNFVIEEGEFDVGVNNDVTIRQNFIVDGDFKPNQGFVRFAGTSPQTISGTDTAAFYNVSVDQSPATTLTISTRTTVENNLGVNSETIVNAGNDLLRIMSGPVRTANVSQLPEGAIINGRVIVERYLPKAVQRRHYFHIASPVTNSTLADWNVDVQIARAYQWNQASDVYQQVPLSTPATTGKGFTVDFKTISSSKVDMRGTLAQGPVAVPVTTQTPGDLDGPDGWNLLGNPYPAAIDWDKVVLSPEVYDAVYVWDNFGNSGQDTAPAQLVSFVDGVGTPLGYDGEIAQGQAFWVKAIGNGTVTFNELSKGTFTDANFYRKPEVNSVLRINLRGDKVNDEAVIRLREGATDNFDGKYDAYKYSTEGFRISTLTADNVKAVINALGTSSCNNIVQIVGEDAESGSYTLEFMGVESFDPNVAISLIDQVENKTIDIRNKQNYTFTISDQNVGLMSSRFSISVGSDAPAVNTALTATGETICEDNSTAYVILDSSEAGVKYSVEWKGTKISEELVGTGSRLELEVNTATLGHGENTVKVRTHLGSCVGPVLETAPVISKVKRGEIKSVENGSVCGQGSVTLRVTGADADGWYQWYETNDGQAIADQHGSEFVTPVLPKSRTYYVSVINSLGCEGQRRPVEARVSYPVEEVTLTSNDFTLTSSALEGNQWYLNGELLQDLTSNTIEAEESGLYTVVVGNGACKSSASIEMTGSIEASDLISVFPNPTADIVYIRVKTDNNNVVATVVNSQGIEIGSRNLTGEKGIVETEFNLRSFATGIYNVRILDGKKVTVKKLAKIK